MKLGEKPVTSLIRSPWNATFHTLVSSVQNNLLLASPFVKSQPVNQIVSDFSQRSIQDQVRVTILTNLRPESALNGSLDLDALVFLGKSVPFLQIIHIPSLHAKVYVADEQMAVVTSANLTTPGVSGNLEYGVAFTNPQFVRQVRHDFENYALLGATVSSDDVEALLHKTRELGALFKKAQQSIRSLARRTFQEKLEETHTQLLKQCAKGKTTQAILCNTILFLLSKGPLRTIDLQPLIQHLQPDLCDDTIDRVIDGVHFGKKWKHHVRSAQQFLKRTGQILYSEGFWHLVPEADSINEA